MSSDPYIWYPQMPGDYIRVGPFCMVFVLNGIPAAASKIVCQ